MNTATPPAMTAVIAITMISSISVTPCCAAYRLRQRIGRIAHSIAIELHGDAGRTRHRHRHQQRLGGGNPAERQLRNGDVRAVGTEAADRAAVDVAHAARWYAGRTHAKEVV